MNIFNTIQVILTKYMTDIIHTNLINKKKTKKNFKKQACERYQNLSEEEKNKKAHKKCQIFLKKKKNKSVNTIVKVIKIFVMINNKD